MCHIFSSLMILCFFLEGNRNYFLNYLTILEVFGSISGLRVNLRKSTILGINTDMDMLQNLATFSECEVGVWPIKYLGIPLGGNPPKVDFWEEILQR